MAKTATAKSVKKPAVKRTAKAKPAARAKKAVAKAKPAAKAKKSTAKAAPAAAPVLAKIKAFKDPLNRTQLIQTLIETTGVAKKDVVNVLSSLAEVIGAHIKPKAAGKLNFLSLFVIEVRTKPATKARKGTNPFTGEEMMFKAKPARKVVKIKALKKLKEMAE